MDTLIAWLVIIWGIYIIVYTKKVGDFTGEIEFAERYLGKGRTYSFLKLIGLAMIIISFMWMTGGLQSFLISMFGREFL